MLHPKELRIGNHLRNIDGKVCTITQLFKNELGINISVHCDFPNKKYGGIVEELSPIQLTQKILETIGFKVQRVNGRQLFFNDVVTLNENLQLCSNDGSMALSHRRVESVDQLQNLYIALTGIELEISPEDIQ